MFNIVLDKSVDNNLGLCLRCAMFCPIMSTCKINYQFNILVYWQLFLPPVPLTPSSLNYLQSNPANCK